MMKMLGIIGGLGPESTVEYYREIFHAYREGVKDKSNPAFIINSVDMQQVIDRVTANDLASLADFLVTEVKRLANAGATFGIISANTPHLAFDEVQRRSPIPLISIVEAAAEAAKSKGLEKVGLMGTRFTMKAQLFPDIFSRKQIAIVTPTASEQEFIHDVYMNELVKGIIRGETRERLLEIARRMKQHDGIEGLLLGGTELSLILKRLDGTGLELLDTMKIQVQAAVAEMLS
jgi:aspartate racemase